MVIWGLRYKAFPVFISLFYIKNKTGQNGQVLSIGIYYIYI